VTILTKLGSMVTILTTLGNQWAAIMAEPEVGWKRVTILTKLGSMVTILTTLGNQWAAIMAEPEVGLTGRWTDCLRHNCALQCLPLIHMAMLHIII
jgi:hypothetical protein